MKIHEVRKLPQKQMIFKRKIWTPKPSKQWNITMNDKTCFPLKSIIEICYRMTQFELLVYFLYRLRIYGHNQTTRLIFTKQLEPMHHKLQNLQKVRRKKGNDWWIMDSLFTLMQRLPVHMMCWIFPGTSMDLNFGGRSGALWGMWRSPKANTNTISLSLSTNTLSFNFQTSLESARQQ